MFSKKIILIICLMIFFGSYSQTATDSTATWTPPSDSPGFGDSNNDAATNAPSVPIDGIEVPLLITGVLVAILVIRRKQKAIT